eukprot:365093-Chlamydomonas_euryale.AAC.1
MEAAGSPGVVAKKYANTNERVYRTIPLHWPNPEDGATWNVGVRTKNGVNIDCLPTREGPSIGVVLYRPGDEQAGVSPPPSANHQPFITELLRAQSLERRCQVVR